MKKILTHTQYRQGLVWGAIGLILVISYFIQSNKFMNHDVSWLMRAAERLLMGGSYTKDFFDNNPPLIIYLSTIPVLISQFFSLSAAHAVIYSVIGITLLSLLICQYYLSINFEGLNANIKNSIIITMAICLSLVFPFEYAQREHLTLIFILPYLILTSVRCQYTSINQLTVCVTGILAGIGFALKPYFVLCYAFVELFLLLKTKNIYLIFRLENRLIIFVFVSYVAAVFYFSPDYITHALPYAYYLHHGDRYSSLINMLDSRYVALALIAVPSFFILLQHKAAKILTQILLLSFVSFIIIYFIQFKGWSYQLLPASIISLLVVISAIILSIKPSISGSQWHGLYLFIAITILVYLLNYNIMITAQMIKHYHHPNSPENKIISVIKQHQSEGYILFISSTIYQAALASRYSPANDASRFPSLWLLSSQARLSDKIPSQASKFLFAATVEDIKRYQPKLIFVEQLFSRGNTHYTSDELIKLYSTNTAFAKQWRNYNNIGHVSGYFIYKKQAILQRDNETQSLQPSNQ